MNIKNTEAERLTRELAKATGESLTEAITVAVKERLDRLRTDDPGVTEWKRERVRRIADDAAARWRDDLRTRDHGDLLYDERGLPR